MSPKKLAVTTIYSAISGLEWPEISGLQDWFPNFQPNFRTDNSEQRHTGIAE
jgi:hypothetical protein